MFRTILWYLHFAGSLITISPRLYKVNKLTKKGLIDEKKAYVEEVTAKWALSQVKLSGAKVTVVGLENIPKDVPVVFMSNHQGNFDVALFMSHIRIYKGFVAKIETTKIPIVSTWMGHLNCVFMDRSNLRGAASAIMEGIKLVNEGNSLVIFPEGTRSKGGPLGEFKAGSFKLATKPKVPIVPITIDGSYKIMEQNGNRIKPAPVTMTIHPPIDTATLSKEALNELPEHVKAIIASKLPQ
ncbi:MAG: lysophospholipid acyltransferase family protein [Cellulosilyticaceae bacterium]